MNCRIPGCPDDVDTRRGGADGLCATHYQRRRRSGETDGPRYGMSTSDVAHILGVSTDTVARRFDAGLLHGTRTERGYRRITPESLAAYVRDHGTDEQRDRWDAT